LFYYPVRITLRTHTLVHKLNIFTDNIAKNTRTMDEARDLVGELVPSVFRAELRIQNGKMLRSSEHQAH
jgi:uncharacterized protein YoxC